jgi:hypothetical protein
VLPNFLIGQHYFRMQADFSIKEKMPDGKLSLTMGTVYYDRTAKKLVYQISFPAKETWVIMDTMYYKVVNNKVAMKMSIPMLPNSTIYEFALINNLDNFGLEDSFYKLEKVEKEGELVISTWMPDKRMQKALGKLLVSKKNNKLYGIAFYTPQNELIKKQFFKDYIRASGVAFPAEITELLYKKTGKETKVSTYKNLIVNSIKNDSMYNFVVPGIR